MMTSPNLCLGWNDLLCCFNIQHPTVLISTAAGGNCFARVSAIDNIPPTQEALHQHVRRAAYIGGYVWGNSLIPVMNLPSYEAYGWKADATPHWTDLPQASKGLRELIKCNCIKGCTGNCKCKRASLPCTELCKCKGNCDWNKNCL